MSLLNDALKRRMIAGQLPPPRGSAAPLRSTVPHQPHSINSSRRCAKNFSPTTWDEYFETQEDVHVTDDDVDVGTFRVYKSGFRDDVHDVDDDDDDVASAPLVLLLHGGGYSGLTWSLFVKCLVSMVHVKVIAIDMRGHGSTVTTNDADMSADRLAKDVALVYQSLASSADSAGQSFPSRLILMGHSMGGAIAVRSSVIHFQHYFASSLAGLVVIDVVEGSALDALQGMQSFLRSRPKDFPSLENAIEWSLRSGQTRNLDSARISMPSQLKAKLISSSPSSSTACDNMTISSMKTSFVDAIDERQEEEEEDVDQKGRGEEEEKKKKTTTTLEDTSTTTTTTDTSNTRYEFRVDLAKSETFWRGWFEGLSQQFLDSRAPAKLLLLAGIDSLDRTLTIGQMQGKFQMQVLPDVGHAVHEDVPDKVAEVVATFLIRNRLTNPKKGSEFLIKPSLPGC